MNPLKHMEVIFGAVAVAALLAAAMPEQLARAAAPPDASAIPSANGRTVNVQPSAPPAAAAVAVPVATPGTMAVVFVKGKRMNSREKRRAALADRGSVDPARG